MKRWPSLLPTNRGPRWMPDPAEIGARVLAAFARGRCIAITAAQNRAAPLWRVVRAALDDDILRGHGERGRAGRIKRRLHLTVSERQVKRILDTLNSASDLTRSNGHSNSHAGVQE